MSELVLEIDVLAGTDIEKAIGEMKLKALSLDVNLRTNFNGVHIFITPYSNIQEKINYFHGEMRKLAEKQRQKATEE